MNFRKPHLHNMLTIDEAVSAGGLLPAFADVCTNIHVGKPNQDCAACCKPFGSIRKRRKVIRIHPLGAGLPIILSLWICGHCYALYQKGGTSRDGVLAAVESYIEADEVKQ